MPETSLTAVERDYLTTVLHRAGALKAGRVSSVAIENSRDTILSRIMRLRLDYDDPAGGGPSSLILKTGLPARAEVGWNAGLNEGNFYEQVGVATTGLLPRCFDTHNNVERKEWHLLLEDLSDSHFIASAWPLPPSFDQCKTIVAARGRLHAAWWDDSRLGKTVGAWASAKDTAGYLQRLDGKLKRLADRLGDNLSRERRELYEKFLIAAPRLAARYQSQRDITVVQGDGHFWNCFLPKAGGEDVRFFDWDSWRIDTGTDDLAYMIAMHWYPERRKHFEAQLLDHYLATLQSRGVEYNRSQLQEDYRLSVLWLIATPVLQADYNIPPVIWWNNLERILLAVDDLGCRDLLA